MRQPVLVLLGAMALGALTAGCATTGSVPKPFPMPGAAARDSSPRADTADALVGTALGFRGVPYRNGGADPSGFDCSGFTQYVYARHGTFLPRAVRDQFQLGRDVDPEGLAPGDLLFFATIAPGASHVAIAVGGDAFVHAPSTAGVVRVERLSTSYWSDRFVGARRITRP